MKTTITKQELKDLHACESGFRTFVKANGDSASFSELLKSNDWGDTWWVLSNIFNELSMRQQNDLHLLGCDWTESFLSNFEKAYPNDKRPRLAIKAKRDFIDGKITIEDLESAESAAWSAAESVARSAAESTCSTRSAESVARSAAWSARSAAWSARSAAWSAESAARSAAWSTCSTRSAESVARSAAMKEMANDLMQLFLKWESENE